MRWRNDHCGPGVFSWMMLYVVLASLVITLHASFILWIVFGAALTLAAPCFQKHVFPHGVAAA